MGFVFDVIIQYRKLGFRVRFTMFTGKEDKIANWGWRFGIQCPRARRLLVLRWGFEQRILVCVQTMLGEKVKAFSWELRIQD